MSFAYGQSTHHAVVMIGYRKEMVGAALIKYWKFQNSWG